MAGFFSATWSNVTDTAGNIAQKTGKISSIADGTYATAEEAQKKADLYQYKTYGPGSGAPLITQTTDSQGRTNMTGYPAHPRWATDNSANDGGYVEKLGPAQVENWHPHPSQSQYGAPPIAPGQGYYQPSMDPNNQSVYSTPAPQSATGPTWPPSTQY